jgi:hypothetical protein
MNEALILKRGLAALSDEIGIRVAVCLLERRQEVLVEMD